MKLKSKIFLLTAMCLPIGLFVFAAAVTPSGQAAERQAAEKFEYEISQKDIDTIELKVAGLRKGASLGDVKFRLGKPTSDRVLYRKQLVGKGRFVANEIVYVLKRVKANENNLHDQAISIFFDENGKLMRVARLGYSKTNPPKLIGGVQVVEVILE